MTAANPEVINIKKNCPGCNHPIDIEVERTPYKLHIEKPDVPSVPISELDAAVEKIVEKREKSRDLVKPVEKEKEKQAESKIKIPAHVKKYKCKSCGKLHENKEFEGLPKGQCETCGSFFTNKSTGKCPYCKEGTINEIDDDTIEEMGLYSEDDEEEGGHDHE